MLPLLATVVIIAALVWRVAAPRRIERRNASRLRTGADGIITGAEPISLTMDSAPECVLLIHGFGDTPQTLGYLADDLHARGFDVRVPLLPGHGRTLRSFAASGSNAWLDAARSELRSLRERYSRVSLVGLSMGGAIAAILASEDSELSSLVLIAPYLELPGGLRRLVRHHRLIEACVPYLAGGSERSIQDEEERLRNLAYRATTPRLVHELAQLADRARAKLARIRIPTLIIQSREDNRLSPAVAESALAMLGAHDKELIWIEGCGHIITVDRGREQVFEAIALWLARWARVS